MLQRYSFVASIVVILTWLWITGRGRKVNPLRQRYDSYDYTVEQHIVGSLLFTPLLLLLPTTSVFYIFFTILMCIVSCACLAIDILRSIIHATPYIKIFLWLVRPRRFPSGMWFEIISCRSNAGPMDVGRCSDASTSSEKSWKRTDISGSWSSVSVSILQSNFLNTGKALTRWATILSLFCHWCYSSSTTARRGHSLLMLTITPNSILVSSTMKPLDFELS